MKILVKLFAAVFAVSIFSADASWQPIKIIRGHIYLPVKILGKDSLALLDTGAELNVINSRFVEANKDKLRTGGNVRVKGIYSTQKIGLVHNVKIEMLGSELSLNNLASANIGSADILLGLGFFKPFVVQIDYPNQRIQFLPRGAIDMKKFANVPLKAQHGSGLLAVQVKINQKDKLWLSLDTGNNSGLLINRSTVDSHNWLEGKTVESQTSGGINLNSASMEKFTLNSLTFGPFELENVIVSTPVEGQKSNIGRRQSRGSKNSGKRQSKGILGYDVMKHFVVTLDYKGRKMHVGLPEEITQ